MNVAGPCVMVLGCPVALSDGQSLLRVGPKVGIAVVALSSAPVGEAAVRPSTRVVVIT
jgi:hypothetical protein